MNVFHKRGRKRQHMGKREVRHEKRRQERRENKQFDDRTAAAFIDPCPSRQSKGRYMPTGKGQEKVVVVEKGNTRASVMDWRRVWRARQKNIHSIIDKGARRGDEERVTGPCGEPVEHELKDQYRRKHERDPAIYHKKHIT